MRRESSKPAPQPTQALLAMHALVVSHDAERLAQIRQEVNAGNSKRGAAVACDSLTDALHAAVRELHDKYPNVFPMATSLQSASAALENYARRQRQVAFASLSPGILRYVTIIEEIGAERFRQDEQFGEQDLPSVDPLTVQVCTPFLLPLRLTGFYGLPDIDKARTLVEGAKERGDLTWAHLALEEFCEAVGAPNDAARRPELVQAAAVIAAWIESIDRNETGSETVAPEAMEAAHA